MTVKSEYKIQKDGKEVVISLEKVNDDTYEVNRDGELMFTLTRDFDYGDGHWYTEKLNPDNEYELDLDETMAEIIEEVELGELDGIKFDEQIESYEDQ